MVKGDFMLKIILALLLMSTPCWATQWRAGTGENTLLGTSAAALIGTNSFNSIVQPLDNVLSNHCNEYLQYTSSTTLTVMSGTCVVSNSQGSIRLFLIDTGNTVLSSTNLDTGSITANTTYYVYSTASTNSTTSSTYYISASNTAPSGQTYYYQIGKFSTDGNSQFTGVINNNWNSYNQAYVSKGTGVPYQALTDLNFTCNGITVGGNQLMRLFTGSISGSLSQVQQCGSGNSGAVVACSLIWPIRKGDYYEMTSDFGATCFAIPTGK